MIIIREKPLKRAAFSYIQSYFKQIALNSLRFFITKSK